MHPQLDKFLRVVEFDRIRQQQTLEDVRKMSQVELIMEVECSFTE